MTDDSPPPYDTQWHLDKKVPTKMPRTFDWLLVAFIAQGAAFLAWAWYWELPDVPPAGYITSIIFAFVLFIASPEVDSR